jgi:hypothetical protein
MADAPTSSPAPVTEEAFTADRVRMFTGFCGATTFVVIGSAVALLLMAFFLV